MSKHCEVCNRSYPDDRDACPYCSEALEVAEADVMELAEEPPTFVAEGAVPDSPLVDAAFGADSAVDLGLPALPVEPGDGPRPGESAASVIEWASLVEEGPEPAEAATVSFDSPSDADLIGHGRTAPAAPEAPAAPPATGATIALPPPEGEDVLSPDLDAVRNIFAGDVSASFARRGPAEPAAPPPPRVADDDSAIDLLAPAGHEPPAEPVPASGVDLGTGTLADPPSATAHEPEVLEMADSGVDLTSAELEAEIVAEAAEAPAGEPGDATVRDAAPAAAHPDSGIDWAGVEVLDEADSESSVLHVVDSGMDLPGMEVVDVAPTAEAPAARPVSDSGIDLSGEDLVAVGPDSSPQAGIEQGTPDTSDSGRDLIAEQVESGINLDRPAAETAEGKEPGSGVDVLDEFGGESATALTAGQLPSEDEEIDLAEMPSADAGESSAVDLGASAAFPAAPPEPPSGADDDLETTRPYEGKGQSIHGDEEEVSPSAVDLGSRHREPADFFDPAEALSDAPEVPASVDEGTGRTAEDLGAVEVEDEDTEPAAVEEEVEQEEETAAEEEAPRPPKKEKRRSTAGAWVGGLFLGGVVTACVLLGLWLFNIEPPKAWRAMVGGSTGPGPAVAANNGQAPAPTPPPGPTAPSAPTFADLVHNYLRDLGTGKADDAGLNKGMEDLEKSQGQSADALFWRGVAKEAAKDYAGAAEVYQKGADQFKDDPVKRQPFVDALNRLSLKGVPKPGGMSRTEPAFDPALLVLLLTGLEGEPPAPAQQAALPEAGSAFWQAEKLARDGQYDKAVDALKEAVKRHQDRRFAELGKAQNPESDPTEEIFLQSCDELTAYWQLRAKLSTLPVAKDAKDPAAVVDALATKNVQLADDLAKAQTDAVNAKKDLETAKKDADDAKADAETIKKDLEAAKKERDAAKEDLAAAKKDQDATQKKADDLTDKLKTAQDDATKKGDALRGVADALAEAKFVKPGASDEAVVSAAKELARSADVREAGRVIGDLKAERDDLRAQADDLRAALKERRAPERMLTLWMPLLRDSDRKDLAGDAIVDADRVLNDERSPAADKARAHAVKGLALRDEGMYGEAKAELARARAGLPKDDDEWVRETETALAEASDPSAYFVARAEALHQEGGAAPALALLDRALETAAGPARDRLLTERGEWRLDEALVRGKGRASPDDLAVLAAQKDADAAKAGGDADAFYLSGRIDEAVGKPDAAAADYRQALAAHADLDAEGALYRAALARVLMQQPHGGDDDPAVKEALKLAGDVLSVREAPFDARAQALAVQGLWTEALTTYVEGLRPHLGPRYAAGLMGIVQGHPSLRRPTLLVVADPLEAAKHYAAGLQFYNDHAYDKAEAEFFTAVEHDGQDARYYYFLGLSRLWQGDRDGYEDFEQGARLERQNRPSRAAVSASLERVQGELRERLNAVRDRPE